MVSRTEARIREIDDDSKSIRKSARAMTDIFDISYDHIRNVISAKRAGFESLQKYKLNKLKQKNFDSFYDYRNFCGIAKDKAKIWHERWAKKRGFNSFSEYVKYCKFARSDKLLDVPLPQRKFEETLKIVSNDELGILPVYNSPDFDREEYWTLVQEAMKDLSVKEYQVIIGKYFDGKTFEEIGKEIKRTRQNAQQMEVSALEKITARVKLIPYLINRSA